MYLTRMNTEKGKLLSGSLALRVNTRGGRDMDFSDLMAVFDVVAFSAGFTEPYDFIISTIGQGGDNGFLSEEYVEKSR